MRVVEWQSRVPFIMATMKAAAVGSIAKRKSSLHVDDVFPRRPARAEITNSRQEQLDDTLHDAIHLWRCLLACLVDSFLPAKQQLGIKSEENERQEGCSVCAIAGNLSFGFDQKTNKLWVFLAVLVWNVPNTYSGFDHGETERPQL